MWCEGIVEIRRNIDAWEETGRGGFGGFGAPGGDQVKVVRARYRAYLGLIWSESDVPGRSETVVAVISVVVKQNGGGYARGFKIISVDETVEVR